MDNQTDFEQIYKQSVQKVYYFLLRLSGDENLAEELTEETFYQAFLHIDRFKGKCEIDSWLCQIAKNAFYFIRKKKGNEGICIWINFRKKRWSRILRRIY